MKLYSTIFILFSLLCQEFTLAQDVSTLITDSEKRFEALHWQPDGRIYAVDYYNGRLYQIYLDGSVETVLSGFTALAGGGFDNDGNFYIAGINTGEIFKLGMDNSIETIASGFEQPVTILQSTENSDTFYVSEFQTDKITKFSLSTGELTPFTEGQGLDGPDGMIYDWNGDLLVSNWENHKIHRIDTDGNVSLFSTIPALGNMGYITIVDEYLYVPSVTGNKLFRVDMDGNVTSIAGTGIIGGNDGAGSSATFDDPNGVCSNPSGDTLLVSSSNSIRVVTNFSPTTEIPQISEPNFSVYPNPCTDFLYLDLSEGFQQKFTWQITDNSGKIVLSNSDQNLEVSSSRFNVPVKNLSPGHYTITINEGRNKPSSIAFIKLPN